jgi:hypothetical protein
VGRWGCIGLFAFVAAVVVSGIVLFNLKAHVFLCNERGDLAESDREQIETAATSFAEALRAGRGEAALQAMSRASRAATTMDDLDQLSAFYAQAETSAPFSVENVFHVRVLGWANPGTKAICRSAAVALGETSQSAHVILANDVAQGRQTTVVSLDRESGGWRPRSVWTNFTEYNGYDAARIHEMARQQHASGNLFNSTLLYAITETMLFRGESVETQAQQDLRRERETIALAPEISGEPPFLWSLQGHEFTITLINYNLTDDGPLLEIRQRLSEWRGDAHADTQNRALIEAFNATHPEWQQIAGYLAVRAEQPNSNTLFGTVYQRGVGYTQPALSTEEAVLDQN